MKIFILSLLAALQLSLAFHVAPEQRKIQTGLLAMKSDGKMSLSKPNQAGSELDMERAKDCAEHFGKCSVKEVKMLKDELHQKRIQNLVFGGDGAPEDTFEQRVVEKELELQLNLLQEEMPPSYLFPEVEEPMEQLPHLKDGTLSAKIVAQEQNLAMEGLMDEEVLESLAICGLIGLLMLAPQLMG